jgi:hypothetical protein
VQVDVLVKQKVSQEERIDDVIFYFFYFLQLKDECQRLAIKIEEKDKKNEELKNEMLKIEQDYKMVKKESCSNKDQISSLQTEIINLEQKLEDGKANMNILAKKSMSETKDLKNLYTKEVKLKNELIQQKTSLETELRNFREKSQLIARANLVQPSISHKEKIIVESMALKIEELQVNA